MGERDRFREPIFVLFVGGFGVAFLGLLVPHPASGRTLHAGLLWIAAFGALVAATSPFWLPRDVYRRINYAYVGVALTFLIVVATGNARSPLYGLYVLDVVAGASFLSSRKAYLVTSVVAVLSLTPVLTGYDDAFFRAEIVRIPVYYFVTLLVSRVSEEARQERRARYLLEALTEVADLSNNGDLRNLLGNLVRVVRERTLSNYVILYLAEEEEGRRILRPVAIDAAEEQAREAELLGTRTVPFGEGITGWVAETGQPQMIGDVEHHPRGRYIPGSDPTEMSAILVPLKVGEQVIGVMRLSREGLNRYREPDLRLAEILAQQAAVAVQNSRLYEESRKLYEQTRWLSVTDPLTGLYNQRYLAEHLPVEIARAERYGSPLSVIMIDSDSLKRVNDEYGHDVGDRFIQELAAVLRSHVRIGDVVVRYAGDEFVLLLPETDDMQALAVAERIRRAVEAIDLGVDVDLAISLGIATYPKHAQDAEDLLRHADAALYVSKRSGKNRTTIYEKAVG